MIEFNLAERRLALLVDSDALERRRAQWQAPQPRHNRGYRSLYSRHNEQAHRGCDFDFLRGAEKDSLPDGLFDGWVGGW